MRSSLAIVGLFSVLLLGGWSPTAVAAARERPVVDLSKHCSGGDCDHALATLRPGRRYHLPAGTWTFKRPFNVPSHVSLTGDGIGTAQGTDLVYTGPKTAGAVVTAGRRGRDWVHGHIAALEIETAQLHVGRLNGESAWVPIDQAGVGLEIFNPVSSSTVDNIDVWRFGRSSVLVHNRARKPRSGFFQLSDFFLGGSPHPLEVRGSAGHVLLRFGGIDPGPPSRLGMLFAGDQKGAATVVESVKVESDYDIPGVVVTGGAPVILVGSTRYMGQSLYVTNPLNSAPAFLYRNPTRPSTTVLQCLSCTALGAKTALALPDLSLAVQTTKWGIDLRRLTPTGAHAVLRATATPETHVTPPTRVVNLAPLCAKHNCDAAFATLKWGGRYYLPRGAWTFSRPFTIPSSATFFGNGWRSGRRGGTELRYVGPPTPGDAAVRFGAAGGDLSAGRLFSVRIVNMQPLGSGFGLRVVNPTNASTVEGISISGFPDGQLLVDDGTAAQTTGPGPNFFRIARFHLTGGVHPLEAVGGRENLLIQQGTIRLGPSSQEGVHLRGGEEVAMTRVIESVAVVGNYDVPGFRVASNAANVFVRASRRVRTAGAAARFFSPGFTYGANPAMSPKRTVDCLACSVSGLNTALTVPAMGVSVAAVPGQRFTYVDADTPLRLVRSPFDVDLPEVLGVRAVGNLLSATSGRWTNAPSGYAYQWLRCPSTRANRANLCTRIDNATQPTYAVTSGDSARFLRVTVTANNAAGAETATSLPVFVSG